MIIVNNLTINIKRKCILNSISCTLPTGRITAFIGKSGAGKTTLLKSLIGLTATSDGQITINEKQLEKLNAQQRSEEIGYVFQEFNLFSNMTVLENCMDPLIVRGISYEKAKEQALTQLNELDMLASIDKYPSELSGGQQQRIAIARSLCLNPRILLLDEPTASLDPINTKILANILKKLAKKGFTIGISSQDMNFIRQLFDRVYYMQEGNIIELCDSIQKLKEYPKIEKFVSQKD